MLPWRDNKDVAATAMHSNQNKKNLESLKWRMWLGKEAMKRYTTVTVIQRQSDGESAIKKELQGREQRGIELFCNDIGNKRKKWWYKKLYLVMEAMLRST